MSQKWDNFGHRNHNGFWQTVFRLNLKTALQNWSCLLSTHQYYIILYFLISLEKRKKMSDSAISDFMNITGCQDHSRAKFYIDSSNGDLDAAVIRLLSNIINRA